MATAPSAAVDAPVMPRTREEAKGRVLLIEPDSPTLEQLAQCLRARGLEVSALHEARALLQDRGGPGALDPRPDVIIAEADRWGDPGLNVLLWLKAAHTDIPVIVLFDEVDFVMMGEADALGANCLFCRPCEVDELAWAALSALPS